MNRGLQSAGLGLLGLVLLSACSQLGERQGGLAQLPEARLPDPERQILAEDPEQVAQRYRRALEVAAEPGLRLTIRRRLADLAMAVSERNLAQTDRTDALFDEPIERYQQLLEDYRRGAWPEGAPPADTLYYQLSKAYALDGRLAESDRILEELADRYPESRHFPEAQFRRAERAFSEGHYERAEALYAQLVPERETRDSGSFGQNARYMRAWAQFKRGDYPQALASFDGVLMHLLADADSFSAVDQRWQALGDAQAEVAGDALRAMALALAYLEGPPSILTLEQRLGPRPYAHRLYHRLADTYREQERYRDTARTYAQFVAHHPSSDLAPGFSVREIETYREGRYPSLIRPAKQAFVRRYGLLSPYWFERGGRPGEPVLTHLHDYLGDLANYQHARAQRLRDDDAAPDAQHRAFVHAATWYREFVATFPEDPQVGPMEFLLAEVLNEAGREAEALVAYERVAFERRDPEHGREAGYAAVLLGGRLAERAEPGQAGAVWQRRVRVGRAFADHYPEDPRATGVMGQLAVGELQRGDLLAAEALALELLDWQPPPTAGQRFSAWLVLGHSRFEQNRYADAEQAYWQALEHWPETPPADSPSRDEVRERIAASLYQRARQQLDRGETAEAVALLQQIPDRLPDTRVAVRAQYDAAHYLMELERWPEAEQALLHFGRQYPADPLAAQLPARLAAVYRAQENWPAAAAQLRELERTSGDPELRRESLFLAAELYQRAGQPEQAIDAYRAYAHQYSEPAADRREAEYQLTELYREAGDSQRRSYWLERLVSGHSPESARATYLAAFAQSELAEQSFADFARISLSLPLKPSLDRKRAALERALSDQEAVLDYGVAEFTTRASHRMAAIYHQLSRDLMSSERPEGLGVLELEQYDILLEEQAYPFEERAIELYEINTRRTRQGLYDQWVQRSFEALAEILPARFGKREQVPEVSRGIY